MWPSSAMTAVGADVEGPEPRSDEGREVGVVDNVTVLGGAVTRTGVSYPGMLTVMRVVTTEGRLRRRCAARMD